MFRSGLIAVALITTALGASDAHAQRRDQDEAFEAARSGRNKSLGDIIARVTPRVRGAYIGSDFDAGSNTYRLKYMRDGAVVVVDVDARTGALLASRGN